MPKTLPDDGRCDEGVTRCRASGGRMGGRSSRSPAPTPLTTRPSLPQVPPKPPSRASATPFLGESAAEIAPEVLFRPTDVLLLQCAWTRHSFSTL
eukprot:1401072-Rhodomonas_salina.4